MTSLLSQGADGLTVAGRKRLELARALATDPKLLLLDEVMAGLNPAEIDDIVKVIKGIRDRGVTIFLIEHVMKAVMNYLIVHMFLMMVNLLPVELLPQ
jgi:branched-chain amino acid transport system ATP-binding protein